MHLRRLRLKSQGKSFFQKVIVGCICVLSINAVAQETDREILLQYVLKGSSSNSTSLQAKENKSTLFFPTRLLYGFYRQVISDQISANCTFDLTCARFSAKAFEKANFIKAGFLTFDRLMRCHPVRADEVPLFLFNVKTGKLIDDPAMY